MVENEFGELLLKLRKEMNLTQKELSEKLGISDKAISRWETGKNFPTIEMVYQISKFFKIPFQDLLTARMISSSGEDKSDVFPEIIKEFNSMNKRKLRIFKVALIVLLIISLFLVGTIIFTSSYNRFTVYDVAVQSDELEYVSGIYVETRIKDVLSLRNINKLDLSSEDSAYVDIFYKENGKEYIIQSFSNLNNVSFSNMQSYIKIDDLSKYLDKLYLRVKVISKNNNVKEYSGKMIFNKNFSNNKIFINEDIDVPNNNNINLTSGEIETILMNNAFIKIYDNLYYKESKNFKIYFYLDTNKIEYYYDNDGTSYKYIYNLNNQILEVNIYNKSNIEIENYKYDAKNNKVIECITGRCKNYQEAMDLLNKNVLNLFKKS